MGGLSANEIWIVDAGDAVLEKRAEIGADRLSPVEQLIYCLWVADYGMRNAGDLEAAKDVYPEFKTEGTRLAKQLNLEATHRLFSLPRAKFEEEYDDRFEAVCDEIKSA